MHDRPVSWLPSVDYGKYPTLCLDARESRRGEQCALLRDVDLPRMSRLTLLPSSNLVLGSSAPPCALYNPIMNVPAAQVCSSHPSLPRLS